MTETEQASYEIRLRISQLHEFSGTDLKKEMDDLKRVLLQNPAACALIHTDGIGLMVRALKTLIFTAKEPAVKPSSIRAKRQPIKLDLQTELTDE